MSANTKIRLLLFFMLALLNFIHCQAYEKKTNDNKITIESLKTNNMVFSERNLRENLLSNYSASVRPVAEIDRPTLVNITLTILQIMGLVNCQ